MRIFLIIAALLVGVLSGCTKKENKKYIPEDDLAELLLDLHVADAFYLASNFRDSIAPYIDSASLYAPIFSKHGYTKEQFDTTLAWYTSHPQDLEDIYADVMGELSAIQMEYMEIERRDSNQYWIDSDSLMLPASQNALTKELLLFRPGKYAFSACYKIDSGSVNKFNLEISISTNRNFEKKDIVQHIKHQVDVPTSDSLCIEKEFTLQNYGIQWVQIKLAPKERKKIWFFDEEVELKGSINEISFTRDNGYPPKEQ